MKHRFLIAAILAISAASCTSDKEAIRAVEAMGMKDVRPTGYRFFGCGEDDTFHTGFEATNVKGERVTGVVCSAVLKGATVRLD